jgi:shikimate dehydrogenase
MIMNQEIRGDTRIVGLLGYPVAHSISPQIHNHAFRSLNLNFAYVPFEVPPQGLGKVIQALRSLKFAGANVTIPHKRNACNYCDIISPLSNVTGTVNTLYLKDGLLYGTTTDPEGFYRALSSMSFDFNGSNIVILGNGGTARTLAYSVTIEKKPASLTIVGRNETKVSSLAQEIRVNTGFNVAYSTFDNKELSTIMENCGLLVNTTNVGMHPNINETPLESKYFHSSMTVFDVIYNPGNTRFLAEAAKAGCGTQNGLKMLLYQGLASSKLWSGIDVPESIYNIEELQNLIH